MERLIAFGCSLTYGHGLSDCHIPPNHPGENPSALSWPSILAKKMNRICINESSPGASNKRIWNDIIKFSYRPNDIVFVLWSFPDRTAIIRKTEVESIGPWTGHTFYKDLYDQHDMELMSKLFINHANNFLNVKNIEAYNLVFNKQAIKFLTLEGSTIDHIPIYLEQLKKKNPLALDMRHPGHECQEIYSEEILQYINLKCKSV